MKITTRKIIRELEKKGWDYRLLNLPSIQEMVRDTRDIIDEILKQQKNRTIR